MKTISIAKDILPIAEFKTSIARCFRHLRDTGGPLIITQNGKPAGVLLSPEEYDDMAYQKSFVESVSRGLSDAETGNVMSTQEIKTALAKKRNKG